jgi:CRISPR system Cascade subunit CasA
MNFTFDLTGEPWIPCLLTDGTTRDINLAEVLVEAPSIREVLDPSPIVTASMHRLLLAIVHRVYGPRDDEVWEKMWLSGRFEEDKVEAYFREWRHRFDLFDTDRPFYQVTGMPESMSGPPSLLSQDMAAGNNDTLFDHSADSVPTAISAPKAARLLVARQAFSLGGLITAENGRASAKAAPLAPAAVTIVQGENLYRTLLLNLVRYDPDAGDPFPSRGDCPAWEQDAPAAELERAPKGYLDYLTWQSRRVHLRPEADPTGVTVVPMVIIAKGNYFPSNYFPWDTMTPHGVREKAPVGQDPRPPVRFLIWRALWRNSLALMQADSQIAGEALDSRPETLGHLAALVENGVISRKQVCSVSVLGLCSNQAKVHFWRHERVALPLAYLVDDGLVGILRAALGLAEEAASSLRRAVRNLASAVLQGGEGRKADRDAATQLADSLGQPAGYWSSLEPAFPVLLQALPEEDQAGRETALVAWVAMVEREVWGAWGEAIAGLPENARSMWAVVAAEGGLRLSLGSLLKTYKEVKDDEA